MAASSTVLDAARKLNIHIPTLCFLDGHENFTSCMICVVHEKNSDMLIPACSAPVAPGMRIETDNEKVREARKDTLDLLLSEHVGDCEAPCQRACPANMNIPLMIRQIGEGRFEEAISTVKKDIAIPAVLGRICPAPCENACNRKYRDNPVSICLLKRFVADVDLSQKSPYKPPLKKKSGKRVAIVGAGPAGLAAAYHLLQLGHACHAYDDHPEPGGMLRYGVSKDVLPGSVLDKEIDQILALGMRFHAEKTLGKDITLEALHDGYDAVVLSMGTVDPGRLDLTGIGLSSRGIDVNRNTFETSILSIFAGGNSIGESKRAIRAVGHGKSIAVSVNQALSGTPVTGLPKRFNSGTGKIQKDEIAEFKKGSAFFKSILPAAGMETGYQDFEAKKESSRCFHCDCRKPVSCQLRKFADEYAADQKRFRTSLRSSFERIVQHDRVIYEPGKCIKCGLCVQITKKAGEKFGLTFVGRGFDVRITSPFNESLDRALKKAAQLCVTHCPTAALSARDSEELDHVDH